MKIIVITSPDWLESEASSCNAMFAHGLEILHLRKPGAEREIYEKFILDIEPRYRKNMVLHAHYDLVFKYQLRGIHLRYNERSIHQNYLEYSVSISCHSVEEIKQVPFQVAYCFLSPIFDSISKQGYHSPFSELPDLSEIPFPVIALGGITPDKIDMCRLAGFKGVAVLGYIWKQADEAFHRFIRLNTPFVMSIAGFDPSAGAGVTSDLKTFEATGSYGLGVCSAITFQNENSYIGTNWVSFEEIRKQCELQFQKHHPAFLKIGLMESFEVMEQLTAWLSEHYPDIKIIWDPILKASSGYTFHSLDDKKLAVILKHLYLITPNTDELKQLWGSHCHMDQLQEICKAYQLHILWKGGHSITQISSDCLISGDEISYFSVMRGRYDKHGTGCIVSAAIASALSQGFNLKEACNKAQIYVSKAINGNDSNLSFHYLQNARFNHLPSPSQLNLQYITAPKEGTSVYEQVESVCRGGVRWVQLRMKHTPVAEILQTGQIVKEICKRYDTLFMINDNVDIARQLDADGVHLGKEDMPPLEARKILGPDKIIGVTCNTWNDILQCKEQQVDYIGLGPFTFTTTKEKLSPVLGLEGYKKLLNRMKKENIHIPVFAIGGITENDIPSLMHTGIQGIALSGLIKNSDNISRKSSEILSLLNNNINH